jgi:hypothetical protein
LSDPFAEGESHPSDATTHLEDALAFPRGQDLEEPLGEARAHPVVTLPLGTQRSPIEPSQASARKTTKASTTAR